MLLKQLSADDKSQYNNFIAAQNSGSFLQAWEWGDWQVKLGRLVERLEFQAESGEAVGAIQLVKMPLPFGKYYLYAPYGPVIKSQVESEKLKEFLFGLKSKFSDAVFMRVEPKETFHFPLSTFHLSVVKSPNIQPGKTLLIDLSKSVEQLLTEMHHKTRYNIKLAQKHGVTVQDEFGISVGHGLYFKEAVELICQTAKRQGFNTYPFSYYENLLNFFALNNSGEVKAHLYKAIFQNQLLGCAVMVDFAKTRTFLFGGSSEFHKNVMAPYLLHFQAMQDAKAAGFSFYDFWGTETSSGATPGFVRFKLGFGGQEVEYPGAYDIIQNKLYYKIYSLFRSLKKRAKKNS